MQNALRQVSSPLTLYPYLSKDGASDETLLAAWVAGKDFRFAGTYTRCSIRDLVALQADCSSLWISDLQQKYMLQVG
jgi:hypothetical protein